MTDRPTLETHYGLTICNPTFAVKIYMPPLTWREAVSAGLWEAWYIFSQSFLLAASVTSFAWGFGLL